MADIRPKDLLPTAERPADDDYLLLDGATAGTRKIPANAAVALAKLDAINGAPGRFQRTLTEKLSDLVSVKDFGAVDDDATSNTTAIQAALDSGAAVVTFPGDGVYITGPLDISAPIKLDLGRATLKLANGSSSHLIRIQSSNVTISGGILDGNGPDVTSSSGIFISTGSAARDNILLEDIEIKNTQSCGIRVGGSASAAPSQNIVVRQCYVHDTGHNGVDFNWRAPGGRIVQNRIEKTGQNGIWAGNESHGLIIAFNDINAPGRMAIEVWSASGTTNNQVVVAHNIVRNGANAVAFGTMSAVSVDRCPGALITGNSISDFSNMSIAAIEVVASSTSIISDNSIERVSMAGLSIDKSDDCTISPHSPSNLLILLS